MPFGPKELVEVVNWHLDKVMGWLRTNKLKFNPDKMEMLMFNGRVDQEMGAPPVLSGDVHPLKE